MVDSGSSYSIVVRGLKGFGKFPAMRAVGNCAGAGAGVEPAVEDEAHADAGAHGDAGDVALAAPGAQVPLGQHGHVHVVVQAHGQAEALTHDVSQGQVLDGG